MTLLTRRRVLTGIVAAPAVLRLGAHMPVRSYALRPPTLEEALLERIGSTPLYYNDEGITFLARIVSEVMLGDGVTLTTASNTHYRLFRPDGTAAQGSDMLGNYRIELEGDEY